MHILLFIFYLFLFSVALSAIPFFKNSAIGKGRLLGLFYIKILAGIAYGKFYTLPKYYTSSDTWRFYRLSINETKWLLHDPLSFLKDLFYYGYGKSGNLFSGQNTYWNDLKSNVPVKFMAVFNLFTNSSYYTNIIFFNFLFLFGLVALFKVLLSIYPSKKWIIILGIFLLPSTLFWCSGIHKDGLILSAVGVSIYCFQKLFNKQHSFKYFLLILLPFLLIFALRNYVLFLLVASILCWFLTERVPRFKNFIFPVFYALGLIGFFAIPIIFSSLNPPYYITTKQHEFLELSGGSKVYTDTLKPTLHSFISFLPTAVDMAFFRPHVNEFKNASYIPAIAENVLLTALFVISVFSINRHKKVPSILFALFSFSITVLLVCGYTIPFTGAIVRYKSVVLPLLITPLLCVADFSFSKKNTSLTVLFVSFVIIPDV